MSCSHVPGETAELLRLALHCWPQTPVFVVGSQVTNRAAFELGRSGAQEFIEASDTERLLECIQQVLSANPAALPTNDRLLQAVHDWQPP